MLAAKLLGGVGEEKLYVDDVFSAYTRTGTGASQVTTTNIDMTQGYMLWSKGGSGATDHAIYDSARGVTKDLVSNSAAAETTQAQGLTAVSATGHTMGTLAKVNTSTSTYVDWVFRKAPKFFDVVTWTGNATNRTISHALGTAPGMVIVKRTDSAGDWLVWHRGITQQNQNCMYLNSVGTDGPTGNQLWGSGTTGTPDMNSSTISIGPAAQVNTSGGTYVAYLWAHDTSTDGLIQCGSFTTDASGNATVPLGMEPQFLITKASTAVQDWWVNDTARGMSLSYASEGTLRANTPGAEFFGFNAQPTATGFTYNNSASTTYLYLAIRRSNKPPTLGTQVYNAIARTGTGAAATVTGVGFAPDLVMSKERSLALYEPVWHDRLRGASKQLLSNSTAAEYSQADLVTAFNMDGVALGADAAFRDINYSAYTYINHFFKRAVGVHDQVCYVGTGVAKTEAHGLGVVPELMIVRSRSYASNDWFVYAQSRGTNKYLTLHSNLAEVTNLNAWNNTAPTSSVFTLGGGLSHNVSGYTGVAYLFATKPGISTVFSFTGDGTTGKVINCGFTTGARFILIKRTDAVGDWFVYDSTRGYPAGNDGHLSLNTTAAEVITTDDVDYEATGFIVNQNATTNLNVTSATYIGLAYS